MVETRFVDMKHFLSVAPPIFYCSPNFYSRVTDTGDWNGGLPPKGATRRPPDCFPSRSRLAERLDQPGDDQERSRPEGSIGRFGIYSAQVRDAVSQWRGETTSNGSANLLRTTALGIFGLHNREVG
jgi:hypothetical protein